MCRTLHGRRRGKSGSGYTCGVHRNDPESIRRVLADTITWGVVGLGEDRTRPAYDVAAFLQAHGKRIVPVHPVATSVLGEPVYRSLHDVPFPIEVVDVFRSSAYAGQFADEAIAIGARAVWFQVGVVDEAAADRVSRAGLVMVMDTCPKIEWWRVAA